MPGKERKERKKHEKKEQAADSGSGKGKVKEPTKTEEEEKGQEKKVNFGDKRKRKWIITDRSDKDKLESYSLQYLLNAINLYTSINNLVEDGNKSSAKRARDYVAKNTKMSVEFRKFIQDTKERMTPME